MKLTRRPNYRWLAKLVPESDLVQAYRANGWSVRFGKKPKRGKGTKPGPPDYDDRVQRDFTAAANQL